MSMPHSDRLQAAGNLLLTLVFVTILAVPHLPRLRTPSLYSDDVQRIADLQTTPLPALWFRPFNEHMAPAFETVSWLAWQAAGRDLVRCPLAFTLAAGVPFVLAVGLLGFWLSRETESITTGLVAMALFGLSPVAAETIFWYSASSFTWALVATMAVLGLARPTAGSGRGWRVGALVLGGLLAPACSAIGILAGPLGTLRMGAGRREDRPGWAVTLAPTLGTTLYLAICSGFRYGQVIRSGIGHQAGGGGGILLALRAPTVWLLPAVGGVRDVDLWLPATLNLALTGFVLIATLRWAVPSRDRGLILAALGLIAGGYLLTYPFRNSHGSHWLFQVERFHLFPQLGLVVLIVLAGRPWFRRFDRDLRSALVVATSAAVLGLAAQGGLFEAAARTYRFPEQRRTLAAVARLGAICRSRGISRDQCLAALPPVWSHWFQPAYNGLGMLPTWPGLAGMDGPLVGPVLLQSLTAPEREALWGGMDVSPYLQPVEAAGGAEGGAVVGRLVETSHVQSTALPLGNGMRRYTMTAWPAHLEFELASPTTGEPPTKPRYLYLPCGPSAEPVEVWWTRPGERWTPARSVRLRTDPEQGPRGWVVPLDRVLHWDPTASGRLRIKFAAAPIVIGEPRLLR